MSFFPPTPTPSLESPFQRDSICKLQPLDMEPQNYKLSEYTEHSNFAGSGNISRAAHHPVLDRDLPPTPPTNEVESPIEMDHPSFDHKPMSTALSFAEPSMPQRARKGRRPASVYPQPGTGPVYQIQRQYTEPNSRNRRYAEDEVEMSDTQDASAIHQLDVDLDAYSTTDLDGEDDIEDREPTLSFVTTSTAESTASTPSIAMSYGYRNETVEGKPEPEPRIRMRATAGRTNAYSSAESSTASGAFSYYPYAEDQIFFPHPPPLPPAPLTHVVPVEHVGLGITAHDTILPARHRDSQLVSPSSNPPPSPSTSFVHRPWQRDVLNRLRSDSASSSVTTASASSNNTVPSVIDRGSHWLACGYVVVRWMYKLIKPGITHLLLASCGSDIIPVLPSLLIVLASTLVVLDLSSNCLPSLPEGLQLCVYLEELNVSKNPLGYLPPLIEKLVALRVLVIDGCGMQNLTPEIAQLTNLHSLCGTSRRWF